MGGRNSSTGSIRGFIGVQKNLARAIFSKVVVGPWRDPAIHSEIAVWTRAACAWHDARQLWIARLGDNMRNVAVTEGDRVDAQIRLRYCVNGFKRKGHLLLSNRGRGRCGHDRGNGRAPTAERV